MKLNSIMKFHKDNQVTHTKFICYISLKKIVVNFDVIASNKIIFKSIK